MAYRDHTAQRADSAGTGAFTFTGAVMFGYQPITNHDDGDMLYYLAVDGAQWEVGVGTYTTTGSEVYRSGVSDNSLGTADPIDFLRPPLVCEIIPAEWFNTFEGYLSALIAFYGTLAVSDPGNITHIYGIGDASTDYLDAPTTGFSHTIPDNCSAQIILPAATLAAGTITFPATPFPSQQLYIKSTKTITALTMVGNGFTIASPATTLPANTTLIYTFRESTSTWC